MAKLFSGLSQILHTSQNPFKKTLLGSMQSLKTFIVEECKVSKGFFFLDGPINQDHHHKRVLNLGMHP